MIKKSTDDVKSLAAFPAGGEHVRVPLRFAIPAPAHRLTRNQSGIAQTDPNQTVQRVYCCPHFVPACAAHIGRKATASCRIAETHRRQDGRGGRVGALNMSPTGSG